MPLFLITIRDDSGFVSIVEDDHKIARYSCEQGGQGFSDYILCTQYDARIKTEQNQICHDQPPTINDGRRNSTASASRTLYDVPEAEVGSPAAPHHLVPSFCSIGTILPSRPARGPCRRAQRRSRMARLRATASAARSVLDGCEHDGMLSRVGSRFPKLTSRTIKKREPKHIKKQDHAQSPQS